MHHFILWIILFGCFVSFRSKFWFIYLYMLVRRLFLLIGWGGRNLSDWSCSCGIDFFDVNSFLFSISSVKNSRINSYLMFIFIWRFFDFFWLFNWLFLFLIILRFSLFNFSLFGWFLLVNLWRFFLLNTILRSN